MVTRAGTLARRIGADKALRIVADRNGRRRPGRDALDGRSVRRALRREHVP
jgi:hypothetical protein